ncbi:MAG: ABC transporter permease, partial [Clostridiales bacterium]|nr:ABC transporter permease [Candidatus Blautia equi]
MKKFLIKRILISMVLLVFVSMIIYGVMRCLPSSYVETQARTLSSMPGSKSYAEWVEQLNTAYGLDTGIIQGYFSWAGRAVRGDFGDSWFWNQPVLSKFSQVIWYSFALGVLSFILEIFIAIPLGIAAARKQYSKLDYTITVAALVGISLPSFFFATILKYIFSMRLGWFDLYGMVGRMHDTLSPVMKIVD